jgi:branched-chain amino acid transport system permease protein
MSLFEQIVQLTVNGISIGAIYALVALGLVMTYRATEVINFAHGDVLTASAFVGWALIALLGWPFWLAAIVTVAFGAVLAYQLDARVMRRIVGQPQFASVMLTIALAFIVRGAVSMIFGSQSRTYATPWSGRELHLGNIVIGDLNLVIILAATILTGGLFVFLRRSTLGAAVQAVSQNQRAAYLCGIPVKQLNSWVWALSGGMAAAAGLLLAPIALVDINMWEVVLKAFAAVVLGGFGSISGAIAGGLVIGIVEQFAGVYLPDGYKDIVAYLILITVLLLRPRGLFGEAHGRRV